MREPKFRGMNVETGEWSFGHGWFHIDYTEEYKKKRGISERSMLYTETYPVECFLESMGEYTKMKDIKGVEIYEGDIILYDRNVHPSIDNLRYVVEWFENGYILKGKHNIFDDFDPGLLEVIGNIYEHGHLLEGEN